MPTLWRLTRAPSSSSHNEFGEHIGLGDAGVSAQLGEAVAVGGLEFFDDVAGGVIDLGQFDRGIGHIAASIISDSALGADT